MLVAVNNDGDELKVIAWAMTNLYWEYYITEINENIGEGYVMGYRNEHGSFYMDELQAKSRLFRKVEELSSDPESANYIAPPEGYSWKSELQKAA